ncbi:NB-ARC [Dillenia turbinata]|uniref:NB-ARC n=1 Tax=Dillenia turbinata TaxID=194707 RepID=A0AAN8ZDQ5_9MAGN
MDVIFGALKLTTGYRVCGFAIEDADVVSDLNYDMVMTLLSTSRANVKSHVIYECVTGVNDFMELILHFGVVENINNYFNINYNAQTNKRKLGDLKSERRDLESELNEQICPGKRQKQEVERWQQDVEEIEARKPSISDIQKKIPRQIHLSLLDEDEDRITSAKLARALALKENEYLVVLDDVREYISLGDLGILMDENRCKLIITTQSERVCHQMGCQKIVEVKPLVEEEAWGLFSEELDWSKALPLEVEGIAKSGGFCPLWCFNNGLFMYPYLLLRVG